MMSFGMVEMLIVVLAFASGGIGLPLGMPPGPEDPMLGRFAPEDAQVYVAWTGFGKLDGDDPTSRWMAKPEILMMGTKLIDALGQLSKSEAGGDDELSRMKRLVIKATEASLYNGAAIFASGIKFDTRRPKFEGALLIPLGDQAQNFQTQIAELKIVSETAESPLCKFTQHDGQQRIFIDKEVPVPFEVTLKDGYLIVGLGEGMLDQGLANIQTNPPEWFTDYRQRLTVKEFSSMAYLSSEIIDDVDLPMENLGIVKSITAICFVSGMDDQGAASRTAVDLKPNSKLESLLPSEPLRERELARLPRRPLLGMQTRVPVEAVVDYIASVGEELGDDPVEEAAEQVEELFGISLQEEMLNVFDGFASISIDIDLAANRPLLIGSLGIGDEMSFPAVYETVIDTVSQWPEVEDRMEEIEHRDYTIYEVTPQGMMFMPINLCWAHADDQLIFASTIELVADQIDRMIDGDTFAETERADQLKNFGLQKEYGNPVAITTLDPVKLIELYFQVVTMWGVVDDNAELLPGFTMGDIPDVKILTDGVDSSVNGVYRTPNGFEMYGRNTLPGSSPPVSMLTIGGMTFTRTNVARDAPQVEIEQKVIEADESLEEEGVEAGTAEEEVIIEDGEVVEEAFPAK